MNNDPNPFTEINSKLKALTLEIQHLASRKLKEKTEDKQEVFDISGASKLLKIPEASIRFHIKNNMLPCHKPGRRLLFIRGELLEWLTAFNAGETEEKKADAFRRKYNLKK